MNANRKNTMIKRITVGVLFLVSGLIFAQNERLFPYRISLTGTTKPSEITEYFGKPHLATSSERYSEDGIALTYKEGDQIQEFSGFSLDAIPFTSEFGVIIEFKYAMVDGQTFNGRYGDGMSLFIYDSNKDFEIGAHGASLGYAYRNNEYETPNVAGLNGAYLGVGLDVYGDFKTRSIVEHEKREGIWGHNWSEVGSHITIRGGQLKNNRYKGYPVLYTINANKKWTINRARLAYDTGEYDFYEEQGLKTFEMHTGYDVKGNIKYNKVIVGVTPSAKGGTELEVRVADDRGEGVFIRGLHYPDAFKTFDQEGNLYNFETTIPTNFKIGFAAATAGAYQKHLVKDIVVRLPYEPEMEDLVVFFCHKKEDNEGRSVDFDVYDDTYFYSGSLTNRPTGGNSSNFVDYTSFRFEDEEGYAISSNPFKYVEQGVGTWEYDGNRTVVFTAERDDLEKGEYSIYYSAKGVDKGPNGGPFGEDVYRSRPTKLTVLVDGCKKLINPNLPIKAIVE